jgi:transcriptional regulator with XRE-family HTH domain
MVLPQHSQPLPIIDGDSLKKARTEKNLTEAELAKECILVAKHIVQLENGESSNFFSAHHKVQVAKKVGRYLGLQEHEYLDSNSNL